jgi:hypothetical protein
MEGAIILHCGIACFQGFGGAIALCKLLAVWLAQPYRRGEMSQIEGPCNSLKILYACNMLSCSSHSTAYSLDDKSCLYGHFARRS